MSAGHPEQSPRLGAGYFNGRLRDECLNTNLFFSIADARRKLETWRADYNTVRPHSSLGDRSPSELLEAHHREAPGAAILNH
jgi:putative transposase